MEYREYIVALFQNIHPRRRRLVALFFVFVFIFNVYAFGAFIGISQAEETSVYFFDVGQGDSEFVVFPNGARILIDGGPPNGRAVRGIDRALGFFDRYIDVIILTHPEEDHLGGLIEVLQRIPVGVVLTNNHERENAMYQEFARTIEYTGTVRESVASGDIIRYGDATIEIISPSKESVLKNISTNDASIVFVLNTNGTRLLFSGDIGEKKEKELIKVLQGVDVLKVAHHGSKYSSSDAFLGAIQPTISFVGVGKNSYGHPTDEVLERISSVGSVLFRTDRDHTLRLDLFRGIGRVYSIE